jgi:hypothetical protein
MEKSILEGHFNRYEYTQAFKEKVVLEVYYQGKDIRQAVEEYDLPSVYADVDPAVSKAIRKRNDSFAAYDRRTKS